MDVAESVARTIDCDMSVRKYNNWRKSINCGRKILHCHSKIAKYKHQNCTPKNIRTPTESSIEVDLQDVMEHQAFKLLTPEVKAKMVKLKAEGATFVLYFKYGED